MSKALKLIERDPFFDDAFFTDSWGDFDLAMQKVLDKFDNKGLKVGTTNRQNCTDTYRTIRKNNIDDDLYTSQALQVTEQDGKFQCVMDVKDFNPNNLQVKVVENRVVVDGNYEKRSEDGSSVSSKSFHREFTLPSSADLDLVSTALSRDGVLTVKAPKKDGPGGQQVAPRNTSSTQVQESSSSSVQKNSSSSVQQSSTSVKKSFSSTQSSSFSSNQMDFSSGMPSFDDMSRDMRDRLLFTHDNVDLKLPEN